MADIPATRASLLVRLCDGQDQSAWSEFVRLYAPVVYRFARRRGLQDADAADVTQEVLRSKEGTKMDCITQTHTPLLRNCAP